MTSIPPLFRLAGLLLLALAAIRAPAAELVDLARAAKPSVVQLLIYNRAGEIQSSGTGFFIGADGRMVTNWHVVDGASRIEAEMADGRKVPVAGLLASDRLNDIAIIQCKFTPPTGGWLELLPAGTNVEPGQRIFVIGAPRGMSGTVSEGIVSALRSAKDSPQFWKAYGGERSDLIQMTAAVSHGSSGSPVLDANGKVVAVAVAILFGGQNLNFAVPVGVVHKLLGDLPETPTLRPFAVLAQGPNAVQNLVVSLLVLLAVGLAFRFLLRPKERPRGGRGRATNRV